MLPAIIEIHLGLLKGGYSEEEADSLVARLMEEEAYGFVECMSNLNEKDYLKIAIN